MPVHIVIPYSIAMWSTYTEQQIMISKVLSVAETVYEAMLYVYNYLTSYYSLVNLIATQ